ncbi:phage major capsid protein [Sphingobacterium multivorum]|uniref:Putative Phage major capsid protein, HK97 family n=1 Tax=Sphingobacterium multivorum TaxID=28454 RepID=A0A654D1K5_SPHMU|nr:phage major capsid protein [Sphingobacterium multivorum]VXC99156.1 putative Phage major capsid protein, HK97 family [Sphingobacterium multivorum]
MDEKEKEALEKVKAAQKEAAKEASEEATKGFKAQLDEAEKKAKSADERAEKAEQKAKELEDNQKEMQKHLDELDVELQNGGTKGQKVKSLSEELKEHEEAFKAIAESSTSTKGQKFEIKAVAAPMTTVTVAGNSPSMYRTEVDRNISRAPRVYPRIAELVNTQPTDAGLITYVSKVNEEGTAEFTAEGALKPLRSFEFVDDESKVKKVAVVFKVTTETLKFVDQFESELRVDGIQAIEDEVDIKLISGDSATTPKEIDGLLKFTSPFNVTGLSVADPNNYDAIAAAALQVSQTGHNPNIALVPSVDHLNLVLTKGEDGHYVLPLFNTKDGTFIGNVRLVVSDEVGPGEFIVGDFTKFRVRPVGGLTMEIGVENDDLRRNLRTVVLEKFMHAYVKRHDRNAFVHDTFANVKAAIKEVPTP